MSYVVTSTPPFFEYTTLRSVKPEARPWILNVLLLNQETSESRMVTIGMAEMIGTRYLSFVPSAGPEEIRCPDGQHEYVYAGIVTLQPEDDKPGVLQILSLCGKCHHTIATQQ